VETLQQGPRELGAASRVTARGVRADDHGVLDLAELYAAHRLRLVR
jgi:hypothetical protein